MSREARVERPQPWAEVLPRLPGDISNLLRTLGPALDPDADGLRPGSGYLRLNTS
ncbi:hypothetical protein [Candidatus Poriferisodalis sp.]|uniref:hypothetical protein n=1 Tax=Candidatus Poriferisodalis sp. TaxID=3101277 RepID=UPI003B022AA3